MRNLFFKIWYWYISTVDKNAEIIFMNFGYSNSEMNIKLKELDEKNRYSAQLYHLVASAKDISGKDILEVGCGRGGGLSYINRYLFPKTVTGIDLNKKAVKFCNTYYKEDNAEFLQADAQKLPFEDNSFDFVINVESSHRYPDMTLFLSEVERVLKPGGYFSFTDFRYDDEVKELDMQLKNTGLTVDITKDITDNVVEALTLMTPDREKLVKKLLPRFLHGLGKNFAAVKDSETYNFFKNRRYEYLYYLLRK